jgi:hypothetical protein
LLLLRGEIKEYQVQQAIPRDISQRVAGSFVAQSLEREPRDHKSDKLQPRQTIKILFDTEGRKRETDGGAHYGKEPCNPCQKAEPAPVPGLLSKPMSFFERLHHEQHEFGLRFRFPVTKNLLGTNDFIC